MGVLDFLDSTWRGATMRQWLFALATLGVVYLALSVLRRVLVRRVGWLVSRTATQWDDLAVDLIRRTRRYFLLIIAVYAAARVVTPGPEIARVLHVVYVIVVLLQAGVWGSGIIGFSADHYVRLRAPDDTGTRTTIQAMGYAARFTLWALLVVTALQNFGINVSALVTGLGIGGIAVALAIQNILGDLFAALAIVLDKPFVVGDFIIVDNVLGTIEHVGLKTTRIRSLGGEQIIMANNDLLKSRVRNYKRMNERRVVFQVDVTYDTPPERVERIPAMVREIIERHPLTRFDRCHFMTFADSSLRIETVYYVLDPDYNRYADTQHGINLELLRAFQRERIEFAFPTRTLYLSSASPAASDTQRLTPSS